MNPSAGFGPETMSSLIPAAVAASAGAVPVYPSSAHTFVTKAVSRKKKGSNNRKKAVARLARHHEHVRNCRQHFLHQVSNLLVKTNDRLVLEDLGVSGMLTNPHLAAAISDAAWGERNYTQAPDPEARGRDTNAHRPGGSGPRARERN